MRLLTAFFAVCLSVPLVAMAEGEAEPPKEVPAVPAEEDHSKKAETPEEQAQRLKARDKIKAQSSAYLKQHPPPPKVKAHISGKKRTGNSGR